jgi:hypothetical protein
MALTVTFTNDGTGSDEAANYRVVVAVNGRPVSTGRVEGHPRAAHWSSLVRRLLVQLTGMTDQ